MRWDRLLSDLDGPLDAERRTDDDVQAAALAEAERARITLDARFAAHRGATVGLVLADGTRLQGRLLDAGSGWFLLDEGRASHLVPTTAVDVVRGLETRARADVPDAGRPPRPATLGRAVRALAADRATVEVQVRSALLVGLVVHVGGDHLDLVDPQDVERGGVPASRAVPFGSLLRISRRR